MQVFIHPLANHGKNQANVFLSKLLADMLNTIALLRDCPKQYRTHIQDICIHIIIDNQQ